jgi:hypothetical protein
LHHRQNPESIGFGYLGAYVSEIEKSCGFQQPAERRYIERSSDMNRLAEITNGAKNNKEAIVW